MFILINLFILNIITLSSQCDINYKTLNNISNNISNKDNIDNIINLPKSTFRIVNNCDKQRNFYYRNAINEEKLFILDQFKWKDFNYIDKFSKYNRIMYRYEKSIDATLFEANYDTFPIGDNPDGIFYDISVIPPDCGINNWNKCKGNKLGYNVPLSVNIISDLKNKGGNCKDLECNHAQCKMGMKWPSDNSNVYACPGSVSFIIKFGC
jgi:hypothetical protein